MPHRVNFLTPYKILFFAFKNANDNEHRKWNFLQLAINKLLKLTVSCIQ